MAKYNSNSNSMMHAKRVQ